MEEITDTPFFLRLKKRLQLLGIVKHSFAFNLTTSLVSGAAEIACWRHHYFHNSTFEAKYHTGRRHSVGKSDTKWIQHAIVK